MLLSEQKEFILWAREQGATKITVGDVQIEFPGAMVQVPMGHRPSPSNPSPAPVFETPLLAVEDDPHSPHLPGCKCEDCFYLFPRD